MSSDPNINEDEAEFRPQFVTDEAVKFYRGKDMSVVGPGAGDQRAVLEGDMGFFKNKILRTEMTTTQSFQRDMSRYLEKAYNMATSQQQTIISEALQVPNFHNLYLGIFAAAIYFRQLSGITKRCRLTKEALDRYAPQALAPLVTGGAESKKIRLKKMSSVEYMNHLKADLLRYLRYILA